MIEIIELVQVDLLQTTDNHLFELNNGSREWERERYDLYLIELARINYISRKNHWLWQRRVLPVNWVQIIFHKFNKKFYLPVAFGATHSCFCNSIICKIKS